MGPYDPSGTLSGTTHIMIQIQKVFHAVDRPTVASVQHLTLSLAGVPSTTTLVGDSTSESKHFTTQQTTVAKTSPISASTVRHTIVSTSKQPTTPLIVQTVVSTIEQTIATTVVHTVFASATQPDGSGTLHATLIDTNLVCTITPTITTTLLIQSSTCPNLVSILPVIPVPVPVPFPPPASASVPVEPPPIPVPTPTLPPPPTSSVALPLSISTTTATTTSTTTWRITDTECPNSVSSHFSRTSLPASLTSETHVSNCPCEPISSTLHQTPRKYAAIPVSLVWVYVDAVLQHCLQL